MARQRKTRTKPDVPGAVAVDPFNDRGVGDNQPSDEERAALFQNHLRRWQDAQVEFAAAKARVSSVEKLAKEECGKDAVKSFKVAAELGTPEGEEKVRERIRRELEVARWMGSPVGTQFSMDLDTPDRTPAVDRAFGEGKRAGAAGEPRKPPYGGGTEQEQAWLRGFGEGNRALAQGIRKKDTAPEAFKENIAKGDALITKQPAGSI